MNLIKLAPAIIASFAFLAGCKGGPEGSYKLDKEATKKAFEAELEKKPKEEQEMAKLFLALFDKMEMNLEVKEGGKYEMKTTAPDLFGKGDKPKEDTETGDWTAEGDTITFKGKKEMKCKFDGSKIECAGGKDEPGVTFKK